MFSQHCIICLNLCFFLSIFKAIHIAFKQRFSSFFPPQGIFFLGKSKDCLLTDLMALSFFCFCFLSIISTRSARPCPKHLKVSRKMHFKQNGKTSWNALHYNNVNYSLATKRTINLRARILLFFILWIIPISYLQLNVHIHFNWSNLEWMWVFGNF